MTGALPSREPSDPGPQPTVGTLGSKRSSRSRTEDSCLVVGETGADRHCGGTVPQRAACCHERGEREESRGNGHLISCHGSHLISTDRGWILRHRVTGVLAPASRSTFPAAGILSVGSAWAS